MTKPNKWPNIQARYSPIAPIKLLRSLHKRELLGGYLLLLTHDVLEHPDEYHNLVGEVRQLYKDAFIIMDNSVIELGEAMDAHHVVDAADIVSANCIMTPDALGGFKQTQELVTDQYETLLESGYPLMRVPQGKTIEELVACIQWLRDIFPTEEDDPEYWGVPRWIANKMGTRVVVTQHICMTSATPRVHLLGMSQDLSDDLRCASFPDVMGIDSANPLTMGFAGWVIPEAYTHISRGKYWGRKRLNKMVVENVEWVHKAIYEHCI